MSWRRIVAREWLVLLLSVGIGLVIFGAHRGWLYWTASVEFKRTQGQIAEEAEAEWQKRVDMTDAETESAAAPRYEEPEDDPGSPEALDARAASLLAELDKEYGESPAERRRRRAVRAPDGLELLYFALPVYALIQFVRLTRWSVRTIRQR